MSKVLRVSLMAIILTIGTFVTTEKADAFGYRHYTMCWSTPAGLTECAYLPRNYRIPGVRKPTRATSPVTFVITRTLIRCALNRYIKSDTLAARHEARIYAPRS